MIILILIAFSISACDGRGSSQSSPPDQSDQKAKQFVWGERRWGEAEWQ